MEAHLDVLHSSTIEINVQNTDDIVDNKTPKFYQISPDPNVDCNPALRCHYNMQLHFSCRMRFISSQFCVINPLVFAGVVIRFMGHANVHWTERHSTGSGKNRRTETRHYRNHQNYFTQQVFLWGTGTKAV